MFTATFLGTSASAPTARRGVTATLIRREADEILVDCGEGTQRQLHLAGGLHDIPTLLITHFHGDHTLGIPGMLLSFGLRGRTEPIDIYGPPGIDGLMRQFAPWISGIEYPVRVHTLQEYDVISRDEYDIQAIPVDHPGACYGYSITEYDRPGQFYPDRARACGVTPGPDFGVLQRGGSVETPQGTVHPDQVIDPPRRGRKIVLSGDTRPCDSLQDAAGGADVVIHEATFLHEDRALARAKRHSTARQAAILAREAGIGMLALNHLSVRAFARDIRREAQAVFANSVVTHDGDSVDIPLPERGAPEYHRLRDSTDPE